MVFEIYVRMTNVDTGEILYHTKQVKELFCGTGGEDYLKRVIDSLFRGARKGLELDLNIRLQKIHPQIPDLFSQNIIENVH